LDCILSFFVSLDDQIARISRMKASIFFVIRARMARGHLTKQPLGWTNVGSFLKVCYGSWGQKGCFSVNSMREFADLPPKARQIMVASVMKAHQLLIDNLAAARGSRDDNDSLAGLIVTFFSGICLEQNLGPDRETRMPSRSCR
jgi:TetR/AcrR family transcriptional regulator, copper-responsive repressor